MKKIVLILSSILLFFSQPAFGFEELKAVDRMTVDELKVVAGVAPSSKWHIVDLTIEKFYRLFSGIFGAKAYTKYLKENYRERDAEIRLSSIERVNSIDSWHDRADIQADIMKAISSEYSRLYDYTKSEAVKQADRAYLSDLGKYEYGSGEFYDFYTAPEEVGFYYRRMDFEERKAYIRQRLAEASKRGDIKEMASWLDDLRIERGRFANDSLESGRYGMVVELESE